MSLAPLLSEGWIIASHALMALAALGLGIWQMVGTKGTNRHRLIGYIWCALMMGVAAGSFWINHIRMFGPFSLIHILSAAVLVSVPIAVHAARAGKIESHRKSMQSLFVFALIVTGAFTLLPGRIMHDVVFGVQ
ncbi:DUF2306 domain-containing protein [Tateyamaria omphalii]|uniref:DUF2306 domain-containing protein n=1 Tax=Tateyamaria omphalii TaxID=299262 RepID=UPI0021BD3915|nr:DUF2306 domain-containing protein [Tateyamaria omphalii]